MRTVESYLLHPMRWLDFIRSDLGTKEKVSRLALCHLTWGVIPTPATAGTKAARLFVVLLLALVIALS